jgi:hypothetical protein
VGGGQGEYLRLAAKPHGRGWELEAVFLQQGEHVVDRVADGATAHVKQVGQCALGADLPQVQDGGQDPFRVGDLLLEDAPSGARQPVPAPALEGEAAPARIAAQVRNASVGNQAVLVVRGGGEDAQLSPFDSAAVVSAIATAPVPVITGIGHSHHDTLADAAAWQACVSPAAAAAVVAERLQRAERTLDQELAAIRRAAEASLAARQAARWRRLGIAAVAAAALAALAVWRGGWLAAVAAVALTLAAVAVRRRRPDPPRRRPRPTADTFEDVVQELGAVNAARHRGAASGEDVRRLLEAAEWLDRRGGELLGRDRSAGRPAG